MVARPYGSHYCFTLYSVCLTADSSSRALTAFTMSQTIMELFGMKWAVPQYDLVTTAAWLSWWETFGNGHKKDACAQEVHAASIWRLAHANTCLGSSCLAPVVCRTTTQNGSPVRHAHRSRLLGDDLLLTDPVRKGALHAIVRNLDRLVGQARTVQVLCTQTSLLGVRSARRGRMRQPQHCIGRRNTPDILAATRSAVGCANRQHKELRHSSKWACAQS